ncbi:hypothetical protein B9Z55_001861 [Caenorhabditis nigoni]|uniref:Uncharacterized protein n=1 Tax=Caenorhabditis nigoni TaxID=1611254 RepID=A0A2G5VHL8_9PELO|nr:hypothetical protein B9Z55_001861 [Caenorhabditis nigoni]
MTSEKLEYWKTTFREIYNRSPTSGDYSVAPNEIQALLKGTTTSEKPQEKQIKRGLKRTNFESKMMEDEQFSPVKKRVKLQKTEEEKTSPILRASPRKKLILFENSPTKTTPQRNDLSPKKRINNGAPFNFEDFSPLKTFSGSASKSSVKCSLTPIKSPTKRPYQRQLMNRFLIPDTLGDDYDEFRFTPDGNRFGFDAINCRFQSKNLCDVSAGTEKN